MRGVISSIILLVHIGSVQCVASKLNSRQDYPPVNPFIAMYAFELEGKTLSIDGETILPNTSLSEIYQAVNFKPIWGDMQNRFDLYTVINEAYYEGLNPEHYHIHFIKKHIVTLRGKPKNEKSIAMADIVMTDALLSYSHHLINGKLDSEALTTKWDYGNIQSDNTFQLLHHLNKNTLKEAIDSAKSSLAIYKEFKEVFANYDSISRNGGQLPNLEYPGTKVEIGDTLPSIEHLKTHLSAYYYPQLVINEIFDADLLDAIIDFQMRNGLNPDGIVGKKTYQALNISLNERLNILRINMERLRWLNNKLPQNYIMVNIASFYLHMVSKDKSSYHCRVVVGKEIDQTPVFSSSIKYIVFNPSWNIPYSIASEEILPKLKTNKTYLQERDMVLLQNGQEVKPSKINFHNYTKDNFPFTIRQEPGYNNSLGIVKFMFPNPYAVYLHDTPSKSLFKKAERAFSHGCIRVENPLYLAEQLLTTQGYTRKKINGIITSGLTHTVHLSQDIPIILIYMTCDDNKDNGKVSFYRDIYGQDQRILEELKKGKY